MPNVGDTLALSVQLFDSATDKFVQATLRDDAGVDLGASPVSMPHDANGNYTNSTVAMPAGTDYVTATYETFDDAGFTTISPDHGTAIDTFNLDIPPNAILDCLVAIKAALVAIQLVVDGISQVGDVLAIVGDDGALVALVDDENVKAIILEDEIQTAIVASDDPAVLNLTDDNQIISKVECD